MKTKILGFALLASLVSCTYAGDMAGFIVQPDPSTVKVGEPADLTIKAIDEDGKVVDDYEGTVMITISDKDDNELGDEEFTLPEDGTYTFTEENQGEKKFTKGMIINKIGDYKITVSDFETEKSSNGNIKVINKNGGAGAGKVNISTPQDDETIVDSVLTVAGDALKYRNSKFQVLLDDKVSTDGQIDENGNYQIDLQNVSDNQHSIQVQVLDINNAVVASSKKVNVKVALKNDLYKSMEILPSETVKEGTMMTVNVKVAPQVSTVLLKVQDYGEYPMDRAATDKFTVQFKASKSGKFDIGAVLGGEFGKKNYDKVKKLTVTERIAVENVKFVRDNPKKTIDLTWDFVGKVETFNVKYGVEKEKMDKSMLVGENKYTISNIEEEKTYFVQIFPTDKEGNVIGEESKIVVIEPNMKKAATCKIDNIKINITKKGNVSTLHWSLITGANEYVIYKGDKVDDLIKITTTTGTSYEVPFDNTSKKDKYAYFSVKAICDDGGEKQIDKVKKVKVGPMDWLIYSIIIAMMLYGVKLAYRTNE